MFGMPQPNKILIVEDSTLVTRVIRHVIAADASVEPYYADSFAQAREVYEDIKDDLFAALVDLSLPDAPDGEVVDYMLDLGVPTIVLTGSFDEERREELLNKGIVDYVTKEGRYSYTYALNLIARLRKNQSVKVLVVEDSQTSRSFIVELLRRHLFQVLEAGDGVEAINVVLKNPDIKLLITDYNMPNMDGFELVQNLRGQYDKTDMIIIGLSGVGQSNLSVKFIKNGANDFLAKPFLHEEFFCRIMHNVESLELIEQIKLAANVDALTGAWNRRYFFEQGQAIFAQAREHGTPVAAVVLDIDHFKAINDRFGHAGGDQVLCHFSRLLTENLSRFLVARTGGEEFFALLPGLDNHKALALIDRMRQVIAAEPLMVGSDAVNLTFSAGVCNLPCATLDEQISLADRYLYQAKSAGRNQVVGDSQ